jgi:uncharacterized protein (TIGR02677 family)
LYGRSTAIENKGRSSIEELAKMRRPSDANLFQHVTAEKTALYRTILEVFARARRQYRLQLHPDEVLAEARWGSTRPAIDELNAALQQLVLWGNQEAQHNTQCVSTLEGFNRARFLRRLSQGAKLGLPPRKWRAFLID